MKTKKYIATLFLLYISTTSKGQITNEFNQFLENPELTSWTEFTYSPYSNENQEVLTDYVIKNISSGIVIGKSFTKNQIDLWYVQKYNFDWKIIEDISLDPDSSVAYSEKFEYNEGNVESTVFDHNGEVDSVFQNFYNPSGSLKKTVYRSKPFSEKPIITEHLYTRDSVDLISKFEIISIQDGDTTSYNYSKLYYGDSGLLDSTVVFYSKNIPVKKIVYTYDDETLIKMETINSEGKVEAAEKYIYQTILSTRKIIIIGYTSSKGYIKRIEIK